MEENNKINMPTLAAAIAYTNSHGGGGGGGTSNYNDLSNKPQIGGTTLTGNKSASDLGLVAAVEGKGLSTNDYTDADKAIVGGVTAALAGKQATLTFDDTPTDGSNNPVKSNGIYDALALKQNATDNNLATTSKTVVGAVNELKSGLTNYEKQNNLNLEVPNRKNVLPNGVKSGSFAGVEWTLNNDDSITFNGTATQQIYNKMYFSTDLDLPVGEYIYNGGSESIMFQLANKAESQAYYSYASGSGYIEVTQAMVGDMIARLIISKGTVLNNVTIYPMIRPKSIESGVYTPYIPSVESRIEVVESGLTNVENRDKVFMFPQNVVPTVLSFTGTATPRALLAQIIIVGQGGVSSTVNVSTTGSGTSVNLAATRIYISSNDYNIASSGEDDGKVNITTGDVMGGWGKIYVRSFDHSMDNASVSITYVT